MKRSRIFAGVAALAIALASAAAPVRAQGNTGTTFVVREISPKPVWLKGEVIRADGHSLTVRERDNPLAVHTFTYSPSIQDAMWKILDRGGYQYGDKVSILHQPGQTVALKVHGKPSKPL